jgi:hypothetical protein
MTSRANRNQLEIAPNEDAPRWLGEPVLVLEGSPDSLATLIPYFDRREFSIGNLDFPRDKKADGLLALGENKMSDLIVRKPLNEKEFETPVGIVSKHYKLVQHTDLFRKACDAIKAASIDLRSVSGEVILSAYGSKMALTFTLPQNFDFDPGDGQVLKLRFHCVNSVDGQCRLRIMLGWFRFICGNGLVVGTARLSQRFVHNDYLELPDLAQVLADGLESAKGERASFAKWLGTTVEDSRVDKWIDGPVRDEWGPLAAARVHLICKTGHDGHFAKPGEQALPHRKGMVQTEHVPGAPSEAKNAYHVAQALAWVAKSRRDIQEQLDWMTAISNLMGALLT